MFRLCVTTITSMYVNINTRTYAKYYVQLFIKVKYYIYNLFWPCIIHLHCHFDNHCSELSLSKVLPMFFYLPRNMTQQYRMSFSPWSLLFYGKVPPWFWISHQGCQAFPTLCMFCLPQSLHRQTLKKIIPLTLHKLQAMWPVLMFLTKQLLFYEMKITVY